MDFRSTVGDAAGDLGGGYGYGNSYYGARAYGESTDTKPKYVLYDKEFQQFSDLEDLPLQYSR